MFSATLRLTAINVRKIELDYRSKGRNVDIHLMLIVWRKWYKNATFENMTDACAQFRADLWNMGAIN